MARRRCDDSREPIHDWFRYRSGQRELHNQIEIYLSIVQRKVLTPNGFPCLEAVAERLANFERYFESIAHPFEWKFTRPTSTP